MPVMAPIFLPIFVIHINICFPTTPILPVKPSIPQNLEVAKVDETSVNLTWDEPAAGQPIVAYAVEMKKTEEKDFEQIAKVNFEW